MKHPWLAGLADASSLRDRSNTQLEEIAGEIRDVLCGLLASRTAHFASNLGVVELTLALHSTFDFRRDRLIWDTGHQIYPHKLVTGRYDQFQTIRTRGGLMGYPNPAESEYDLLVTGHAGCSVSTALGFKSGDELSGEGHRKSVAVIGDGAFPSGIVFEALNNAGDLASDLIIVLNDNKMSICPRVGSVARYLDRLRSNPFYTGLKSEVAKMLNRVPLLGDPTERLLSQIKEGVKAGVVGGMMFEDFGVHYIGPIDGHDIALMRRYFEMLREHHGPVLLHVVTEKGHGYQPAANDPVYFHTPPAFDEEGGEVRIKSRSSEKPFTVFARDAIANAMRADRKVTAITAAMCQGNKLEPVREEFSDRFFDVGICESHAVAFAAGQAKVGIRPIVAIYSTFLQRSYDQIFQEAALQNLPVVFMMDRAGLAGPDGPTHHGVFDIAYMRTFPNMTLLAPGDGSELQPMLDFALAQPGPVGIRYPKADATPLPEGLDAQPIRLGKSQTLIDGQEVALVACGAMVAVALEAARRLKESGIDATVVNARFIKPLDAAMLDRVFEDHALVVTLEEGQLAGGFGSAVAEYACQHGLDARKLRMLGLPDLFIEHGERSELLADLGLDAASIATLTLSELGRSAAPVAGRGSLAATSDG